MEIKTFETGMNSLDCLIKEVLELRKFKEDVLNKGVLQIQSKTTSSWKEGEYNKMFFAYPKICESSVVEKKFLTIEETKKEIEDFQNNIIQNNKLELESLKDEIVKLKLDKNKILQDNKLEYELSLVKKMNIFSFIKWKKKPYIK